MTNDFPLGSLDRTLQDIMGVKTPFGSITIVLARDFRQFLLVIKNASRGENVQVCLKSSCLSTIFECYTLSKNMRFSTIVSTSFNQWLPMVENGAPEPDTHNKTTLPTGLTIPKTSNVSFYQCQKELEQWTYPLKLGWFSLTFCFFSLATSRRQSWIKNSSSGNRDYRNYEQEYSLRLQLYCRNN